MTLQRAKEIGIIVSVLFYSLLVFGLTSLFIMQNRLTMTSVLVLLGILAIVWTALVALALAVVQQPGSSATVMVGVAATLVVAGGARLPTIGAGVLLLACLGLARRSIYREMNNRVLYRASEAFGPGLRSLLFGVGIAAVGLAWPVIAQRLTPASLQISPATVSNIVQRIAPALPSNFISAANISQITLSVTNIVNQYIQSLISSYRGLFLVVVLLLAISTWRAIIPMVGWVVLSVLAALIYLARKADLLYLTRSQATVERLHL